MSATIIGRGRAASADDWFDAATKANKKACTPAPVRCSLCFRCEHRALALEGKLYKRDEGCPRYQCGLAEYSAVDCYMFDPVKPPVLAPSESERRIKIFRGQRGRPRFCGAMLAGRESAVGLPECDKRGARVGEDGVVWFWTPKATAPRPVAGGDALSKCARAAPRLRAQPVRPRPSHSGRGSKGKV